MHKAFVYVVFTSGNWNCDAFRQGFMQLRHVQVRGRSGPDTLFFAPAKRQMGTTYVKLSTFDGPLAFPSSTSR